VQVDPTRDLAQRLERWFWTVIYFTAITALAIGAADVVSRLTESHDGATITGSATMLFGISAWRSARGRILRALSWGPRIAVRRARVAFNGIAWRGMTDDVTPISIGGIVTYIDGRSAEQRAERQRRLTETLEMLRTVWPERYRRLERLGASILIGWVPNKGAAGGHLVGTNVILLVESAVDTYRIETLVCVLCHELSHFYVATLGLPWTPHVDSRMELIAEREMRLWARRLIDARGTLDDEAASELVRLVRGQRSRRYWHRDGTSVHGSKLVSATS
jgi:hypothetical protein